MIGNSYNVNKWADCCIDLRGTAIEKELNTDGFNMYVQYLKGSYRTVDLGATIALILLSIIPVIIFYVSCQKHIVEGVAAGAVKG